MLFLVRAQDIAHAEGPIRAPLGVNAPGFAMAGFQLTLYGRIWVTPEVQSDSPIFDRLRRGYLVLEPSIGQRHELVEQRCLSRLTPLSIRAIAYQRVEGRRVGVIPSPGCSLTTGNRLTSSTGGEFLVSRPPNRVAFTPHFAPDSSTLLLNVTLNLLKRLR